MIKEIYGGRQMKKYLNLLRNHNFLYIIGQIVSRFCDSCFKIVLFWYLANLPDAFDSIAVTLLVAYLPQMLVGLLGGYIVDRFDRRKAMILSDGLSAVILFGFYLFARVKLLSMTVILITRFGLSLMDTLYSPAATAYIPRIVDKHDLVNANSLFAIIAEVTTIASTAVAGFILSIIGFEKIIFINCVAYAFAAFMIFLIPVDGKAEASEEDEKFDFKAVTSGFRYAFGDTFVWQFIVLIFLTNITSDVFYNLTSLYTIDVLNAKAEIYGVIQTAISAGMLVSTTLVGMLNLKKAGRLLVMGFLISGTVMVMLGITGNIPVAIILFFFYSFGDALGIPCFTYLQLHVPDGIKGRVFAAFDTLVLFAGPISSFIISTAAKNLGVTYSYTVNGIIMLVVSVIAFFMKGIKNAMLEDGQK